MDNNNPNLPEPDRRYRPIKPSDSMISMLRSVLTALQSMSEYAGLCNNPHCRWLITFHANEVRPIVCSMCGKHIDWENYSITVGTCPKCNEEYNINTVCCPFHSPPILLKEKRPKSYSSSSDAYSHLWDSAPLSNQYGLLFAHISFPNCKMCYLDHSFGYYYLLCTVRDNLLHFSIIS